MNPVQETPRSVDPVSERVEPRGQRYFEVAVDTLGASVKAIRDLARTTLVQALAKPSTANDGSYERNGKKPKSPEEQPSMNATQAAIYIGKLPYHFNSIAGLAKKSLKHTFAIPPEREKIYSPEFIKTAMQYCFDRTQKGQKVRFVMCRSFSELFNGAEDTAGTFTDRQSISGVKADARFWFPDRAEDLEVVAVDALPENARLFEKLRGSVNSGTNIVDTEKALKVDKLPSLTKDSDALAIAEFLYNVAQKNPTLDNIFAKMRPGKIRSDENAADSSKYYGLIEISIRLVGILKGQYINGGVDRQGVYDDFILKVVKGPKGNSQVAKIKEMRPLLELFGDKKFETVHINTKNNSAIQTVDGQLARMRMLLAAWGLAWAAIGARYVQHEYCHRNDAAKIMIEDATMMRLLEDPILMGVGFDRSTIPNPAPAQEVNHPQPPVLK